MNHSNFIKGILFLLVLVVSSTGCAGGSSGGDDPVTVVKSEYTTMTADGWEIALTRHERSTGSAYREPVLITTGYLESAHVSDAFKNQSLVNKLALDGHDVWTFDIRNSGKSQQSDISWNNLELDFSIDWSNFDFNFSVGMKGWEYCIDHLVVFDTPAAIDFVLNKTGSGQLHLVGHSMGALMVYGYLTTNNQSKVKSAVTLGGIGWMEPGTDYESLFADIFFEIGTFIAPLLPSNLPLPLKWALEQLLENDVTKLALLSYGLDTVAGKLFWNHENMTPNLVYLYLKHGLPNTTTNCFKQFMEWAETGDCKLKGIEFDPTVSTGGGVVSGWSSGGYPSVASSGSKVMIAKDYSITKNLSKITTPICVIGGSADLMSPSSFCKEVYNRISSSDKSFVECSVKAGCKVDYGHMDLIMGKETAKEVYPKIGLWLRDRSNSR